MIRRDVSSPQLPGGDQSHLGAGHPLAVVARSRCLSEHGSSYGRLGNAACGACWERVIRDDERFAVLFDLPRLLDIDPSYVDVIAVERACAGERVPLTAAERQAAVQVLVDRGYSVSRIASRLHLSVEVAHALLDELLAELDPDHAVDQDEDVVEADGWAA